MNEQFARSPHKRAECAFDEGASDAVDANATVLRGSPASPGTHLGIARVISDGAILGDLENGDVLVCRTIHPAALTLLARVGALVMDAGGILSSTAILARERGIPAVLATGAGTRLIRDGQRVAVDGERGVVVISR